MRDGKNSVWWDLKGLGNSKCWLNREAFGYSKIAFIVPVLIGCANPIVITRIEPSIPNDHSRHFCLKQLGTFVFENIDFESVKRETKREIGPFTRHQFDSTFKSESGIRNCPEPDSSIGKSYRILSIDSILFKKHNPESGIGQSSGGITFTFQTNYQFTAKAYFVLMDSITAAANGETEYKRKILTRDVDQLQDAARFVAKDISRYINEKNEAGNSR
jgi:hypothetical protein